MNLTVSTLVRYLKNRLDSDRYLQNILVEGDFKLSPLSERIYLFYFEGQQSRDRLHDVPA